MASIFEQTIVPKVPFSNFDLSETQLLTHNFGQLIPCYLREVLPNDVFRLSAFADCEFAPMVAPMKQDLHLSVHFFFCPDRILFEDFETFITGSEDGHALVSESELERMPQQPGFETGKFPFGVVDDENFLNLQGTICDYMGLPNNIFSSSETQDEDAAKLVISDLPFRGYFRIWYDYYRDENLQTEFQYRLSAGSPWLTMSFYEFWREWKRTDRMTPGKVRGAMNNGAPFYRAFKKDYFTGALQSPQKGEPVTINLGSEAPVTLQTNALRFNGTATNENMLKFNFSSSPNNSSQLKISSAAVSPDLSQKGVYTDGPDSTYPFIKSISGSLTNEDGTAIAAIADLSRASAITVEALRESFAVQEILESLSMRGSRFVEFLRGNFGVVPDDYRLQRPQFLGGIVTPVAVQKVIQTSGYSGEDSRDMTGYAAGRAYAAAGQKVFSQRFKEHGYIIGILSVMPKAYYYQGIPRHFMRKDRFDYYLPQTAHLGEQPIENCELYFDPEEDKNFNVFGYIPRWAEYKVATNGIHGDFRGNLDYYHMARIFGSRPTLSEAFISTKDLQTRPFAVWQAENPLINHLLWTSMFFKVTASRPIPYHSIPKIM